MTQVFFYLISAVVIAGALGVVLVRNVVYAALLLIMSLMGVAGIYILLSVEFLALVQVLVYGGAVTVLVLFALMLTRTGELKAKLDGEQKPLAAVAAIALLGAFLAMIRQTAWPRDVNQLTVGTQQLQNSKLPHVGELGSGHGRRGADSRCRQIPQAARRWQRDRWQAQLRRRGRHPRRHRQPENRRHDATPAGP